MRATYSPSTCGMHHMSLRQGLRSLSARRRRTVSRERLSCGVSLTNCPASSSRVHRARPAGGLEQAVATSRASSWPESFRLAPGAWLFAQRRFQVAEHEAPLGPVHGRAAHADAAYDLRIAAAGIRRQQNLRPLELACAMLTAAQQRRQFAALGLAQFHPIAYIHLCLLLRHRRTTESDGRRESPCQNLHVETGPVSGVYPPLHA